MVETNVIGTPALTRAEGLDAGRTARARTPRAALAEITTKGRDPLGILDRQNRSRLADLIPLRTERMAASPFAFYRGTAALMAADFAREPNTGILVPSCGDAHIGNFGFFASPQRTLLFDLNDFDEAAWAPWEWDLKRLVASIVIGAREARGSAVADQAARSGVIAYARALRAAIDADPLQRYFAHFDASTRLEGLDADSRQDLQTAIAAAEKRTGKRAARRLTVKGADGHLRFVEQPPVMTHADPDIRSISDRAFRQYAESANVDVQLLLRQYRVRDVARRVVGVGSVGTRCYLAVLGTPDAEPMILQVKEAARSVLAEYGGIDQPADLQQLIEARGEGARVVGMQRVLQAFSDPFLGHIRGTEQDYYVRQFHDMKGSIDTDVIEDEGYREYAIACAITLARAHAQAPAATAVSGYVGKGRRLAEVLVGWANAYADLAAEDYRAFVAQAQRNKTKRKKESTA
ncbi:DUF2252 domain-containing protein [Microbacterium capsulatum]|uniref:DUF2252 domain-containing protein n=1 Tax=Microbacterium capsulatum TaxID=3041921 RepID=A0ABU0XFI3_9MICO|nr:DUF2252 domain-containing protein [Microbacterium sp. ASV81]MDQ4213868.1 DUF2252 domain-containing protein [Microbacterium sp. ASV81]